MYLLPLKVPHRKIEFWIVFMFIYYSFIHLFVFFYYYLFVSLNLILLTKYDISVLKSFKIHAHLLPLKVRHRNLELWIDLFKCIFSSCLFLGLNLIPIKHRHDISVLKIIHNRPAFIYFHLKCLTAKIEFFELYLCLFIYSFHHLFVFFFYYYLFVSLI